jgi:hypothetical protein
MIGRILGVVLLSFLSACQGGQDAASFQHPVFRAARRNVFALGGREAGVQGTGFVLRHGAARYLVASFHVVSKLERPFVQNDLGDLLMDIRVLAADRRNDVVILDANPMGRGVVGLRASKSYATSQKVFLMGFPSMSWKESHLNFASGFISDAAYHAPVLMGFGDIAYIQATTPVNLGHSGSPLLNERAEVLGVIAWRYDPGTQIQGGNYAVPIRHALDLIERIEKAGQPILLSSRGSRCADNSVCRGLDYCLEGARGEPRTCQPLRNPGEACVIDEDCYLPHVCHQGKCFAPQGRGQACSDDALCKPPNYCILGACMPLGVEGEKCGEDKDCLWPLLCENGRCKKAPPRKPPPPAAEKPRDRPPAKN